MLFRKLLLSSRAKLDETLQRVCDTLRSREQRPAPRAALDLAQLEDRVMLSAAPMALVVPDAVDEPVDATFESVAAVPPHVSPSASNESESASQHNLVLRHELVFVDTQAEGYQQLVDDLLAQQDDTRQFDVVTIDSNRDGLRQITDELLKYDSLDAIHVVSHGSSTGVQLGNVWLTLDNIGGYAGDLVKWRGALASDADLLIYGCDLASSDDGQQLIESLGALCECDVAASIDDTGNAALGGDWDLEYEQGAIDTHVAFTQFVQANWNGILSASAAGGEFRVNSTTSGTQTTSFDALSAVASDADGDSVVVWASDGQDGSGYGVFAQRYDSSGATVGSEFQVNTTTSNDQEDASVAMDDNGNFVVVWSSRNQDGSGEGIYARLYNNAATPQTGEILVNTTTSGDQEWPAVAMDADGDFVVTWTGLDANQTGVFAQRFDSTGTKVGGQFQVNTTTSSFQENSTVAMDDNGNFVITWSSFGQDAGSSWGVFARQYGTGGATLTGEFQVNTTSGGDQWFSRVASDSDGDFVITWESDQGGNFDVYAQRYNSSALATGIETRVNTYTTNSQQTSAVAMDADGNYYVTWESAGQDGSGFGIYFQEFQANGTAVGSETHVSTSTTSGQRLPSVSSDDVGDLFIVWSGNGTQSGHTDTAGVFGQRYNSSTLVVTNTNDSGLGSLRAAMIDSNSSSGMQTITFNISGSGPHTINLATDLPNITDTVIIDGSSEPDYVAGTPVIEINGGGTLTDGLFLDSGSAGSTIRGLIINQFTDDGIDIESANNTIVGNWIGLNNTGTADQGNGDEGIEITTSGNIVGGTTVAERNVISGNDQRGVYVSGAGATSNNIRGNYIGTNAAGTGAVGNNQGVFIQGGAQDNRVGGTAAGAGNVISGNLDDGVRIDGSSTSNNKVQGNIIGLDINGVDLGNADDGVQIHDGASDNTVGGTTSAARNVISGNDDDGVQLSGSGTSGNVVEGNYIGTDVAGTANRGNNSDGVTIESGATGNTIGGNLAGAGNLIAFNGGDGVRAVDSSTTNNAILANSIHSNSSLGIDLDSNGVAANDVGDGDTGPNNLQNYPVLSAVLTNASNLVAISGSLNSAASSTFRVEFFANSTADPSGNGEGETYLGFANVTTDASGNATFTKLISASVASGQFITATATDSSRNTSEFAANVVATYTSITPNSTSSNHTSTSGSNSLTWSHTVVAGSDRVMIVGISIEDGGATVSGVTYDGVAMTFLGRQLGNHSVELWQLIAPNVGTANVVANFSSSVQAVGGSAAFNGVHQTTPTGAFQSAGGSGTTPTLNVTSAPGELVIDTLIANDTPTTIGTGTNQLTQWIDATGSGGSTIGGAGSIEIGAASVPMTWNLSSSVEWEIAAVSLKPIAAVVTNTLTVDTTSDVINGDTSSITALIADNGGDGISLREAIAATNNTANVDASTPDEIHFNIGMGDASYTDPTPGAPGSGDEYWIITPGSFLGAFTDPVILDAATQPGYDSGTGRPVIEIDGSSAAGATANLVLQTSNSTIRGFALHGSADEGLEIDGQTGFGDNNTIQGNWIGLDAQGNAVGNTEHGIAIAFAASGNMIGGAGLNEANVIAGNTFSGIFLRDTGTNKNVIQGNLIGVLSDGSTAAGNGRYGIELSTNVAGTLIGGTGAGEGNVIRNSTLSGVSVISSSTANTLIGNQISANTQLGIDLGNDGATYNDSDDVDNGANGLLNFPALTNVVQNGANLDIDFSVDLIAGQYRIEFFDNAGGLNGSGFGEGQSLIGFANITATGAPGYEMFSTTLTSVTPSNVLNVTTTATRSNATFTSFSGSSEFGPQFLGAGVLVVDTTSDTSDGDTTSIASLLGDRGADGFISLREAITATNNTTNIGGNNDQIRFNIAGAGPHTIQPTSTLPMIIDSVTIDGTTEPDFASTPVTVLDGSLAGAATRGLDINAASTIRGLAINQFFDGIYLEAGADNSVIVGNHIGTNAAGTSDLGNTRHGIIISSGSTNNTIGGATAADRNVISGNDSNGINIQGTASGNVIIGNYIGTNAAGTGAIGNTTGGIQIQNNAVNNTIGGSASGQRNVISGNSVAGIILSGSGVTGTTIQGNYIGANATGASLGNASDGIQIDTNAFDNTIGGTAAGAGNLIAYNTNDGVSLRSGTGNSILQNSIHSNTGMGIDLAPSGVTLNDADDSDTGVNNLQNFPVLTSAVTDEGTTITITGTLTSSASKQFRVEFFVSSTADGTGYGEGQTYLGAATVITAGSGVGTINSTFAANVTHNQFISATATVDNGGTYGDTSEFSLSLEANAHPVTTSNGGGAAAAINVVENTTAVTTVTATDSDVPADTLTYSITGGADMALFSIDGSGNLTFNTAPDFESPADSGANNVYDVEVTVTDGNGGSDLQTIAVTVTDANEAPVFTSPGTANVAENTTTVMTVTATDEDGEVPTFSLTGGVDIAQFSITSGGVLTFDAAPDFESPADVGANNVYDIEVTASDGVGGLTAQTIAITVTDTNDNVPVITPAQTFAVDENATIGQAVGTVLATDADTVGSLQNWQITAGNTDNIFGISAATGAITVVDDTNLDYESTTSYVLTLTVEDGTNTSAAETVTININDVNDNAPVITASQSFNIIENAINGTAVGTALATDADTVGTLQNWQITAGNTDNVFTINALSGAITIADNTNLDYEWTTSYVLTLTVEDGVNTSAAETVTINITDVNDNAPVITTAQSFSVAENATNGTAVGTVLATDVDTVGSLQNWQITTGNADNIFGINASTGEITIADNTNLDYETTTSYVLTLTVEDGVNTSAAETVTINILNVNEAGVGAISDINPAADTVAENATIGTTVGITAFATDPDGGDTVTYALDDTAGGRFTIGTNSGIVTVAGAIDYETATSHNITVRANSTDSSSTTRVFTISVTDENDNAPVITNGQSFAVLESATNGTAVGTAAAADVDTVGSLTNWQITAGNTDNIFAINGSSGTITIGDNSNLDFETTTSYVLTLTVEDGVNTSAAETVTINITDVNDNAPVITASQSFAIAESATNGTSVGSIAATDVDTVGSLQNWQITAGNTDNIFAINAATGEITIADNTNLDYETATSYVLTLTVEDGVNTSAAETVTINITDVNDNAPVITASQSFGVAESATNGTSVGSIAATDVDTVGSLQNWQITAGNTDNIFGINAATGEITIVDNTNLDFETTTSYVLTLTVGDGVNTSAAETVTINITDVNDNAPVITASQSFGVAESATNGTSVGTVAATDADTVGSLQNWQITTGNTDNVFGINAATGEITVTDNTNLDFETTTNYVLTLTVDDGVNTPAAETVTINVTDVNDNAPVITASQSFGIAESAANGTSVGSVAATDVDTVGSLQNWQITAGNTDNILAINGATGEITIADNTNLDYETTTSYILTLTVDDGVNTSAAETVTINVTDVDEGGAGPISDVDPAIDAINENAANGTAVGITALATDPDLADTVTYTLANDAGGRFTIDNVSGVVTVNGAIDYETATSHNITVRADSTDGSFSTQSFAISVGDQNDNAPVITASQSFAIAESAANGTSLGNVLGTDVDTVGSLQNWNITSGNADNIFAINGVTGEVVIADNSNLDFETTTTYVLTLTVGDGVNTSSTEVVTINITDVNDNAPVINVGQNFGIAENAANGSSLGNVLATDVDTVGSLQNWAIAGGNMDNIFAINATTGELTIADNTNLDFESMTNYVLTLTVEDGVSTSAAETVAITITDVNDNPPVITPGLTFSVNESVASGTSVGTATATDADTVGGPLQSWTITGGNVDGIFAINGATGEITVVDNTNLDFDTTASYALSVTVSDGLNTSATTTVTVNITNTNESPTINPATFAVLENAANGTSVGTVTAIDPDAGDSQNFTIMGGNTGGAFTINGTTGEITVANSAALDFETTTTFNLAIQVTDGGALSDTATITINLTDVNEAPTVVDQSHSASGSSDLVVAAPGVLAGSTDPEGNALNAVLVAGPSSGSVVLNADGSFVYTPTIGFSGTVTFTFIANDGANNSNVGTVTIDVAAAVLPPTPPGEPPTDPPTEPAEEAEDSTEPEDPASDDSSDDSSTPSTGGPAGAAGQGIREGSESDTESREMLAAPEAKPLEDISRASGSELLSFNARTSIIVSQVTDEVARSLPSLASTIVDTSIFESKILWDRLDLLREEIVSDSLFQTAAIGTATVVSATLSVGYVLWTLRGGYLVASLLSTLPAWKMVDPLPVLETMDAGKFDPTEPPEEDESTVNNMMPVA